MVKKISKPTPMRQRYLVMRNFIESLTDATGPYPFLDKTAVVSDARQILSRIKGTI